MQQGVGLLWLVAFSLSFGIGLVLQISRSREGKFENRRGMTGCELAHQILDQSHFSRTAIVPLPIGKRDPIRFHLEQFFLAERTYFGTRLSDLAQTLRLVTYYLHTVKSTLSFSLPLAVERILERGWGLGWLLIVLGWLLPSFKEGVIGGQSIHLVGFFLTLALMMARGDETEEALSKVNRLEGFGPDEKARLRRLLKIFQFEPLAKVFVIPFPPVRLSPRARQEGKKGLLRFPFFPLAFWIK